MNEEKITEDCESSCKFAAWHIHCKNWKKCRSLVNHWNNEHCKECYDKL